jgi:hypothetical protein
MAIFTTIGSPLVLKRALGKHQLVD